MAALPLTDRLPQARDGALRPLRLVAERAELALGRAELLLLCGELAGLRPVLRVAQRRSEIQLQAADLRVEHVDPVAQPLDLPVLGGVEWNVRVGEGERAARQQHEQALQRVLPVHPQPAENRTPVRHRASPPVDSSTRTGPRPCDGHPRPRFHIGKRCRGLEAAPCRRTGVMEVTGALRGAWRL